MKGSIMPGRKLILTAIAAAAIALGSAASAAANPAGPCEELLYAGVCAPASEQPTPSMQESMGDIVLPPNTGTGIQAIN
jgi:hypothetical protein